MAKMKIEAKPEPENDRPLEERVDETLMEPGKYEITKDHTFEVNVHLRQSDGRWVVVDNPVKGAEVHTVTFRMWNYDEMVDLKKQATAYDAGKRMHMIDNDTLDRLKIQKLLMGWTFDRDNPRLKLHRVQGTLTDESWGVVKRLQPNILTYIISGMNRVYELGL